MLTRTWNRFNSFIADDPDLWNQTLEAEELLEAVESHQQQYHYQVESRRAALLAPGSESVPGGPMPNVTKKRRTDIDL